MPVGAWMRDASDVDGDDEQKLRFWSTARCAATVVHAGIARLLMAMPTTSSAPVSLHDARRGRRRIPALPSFLGQRDHRFARCSESAGIRARR
jgi:hypothetical protein